MANASAYEYSPTPLCIFLILFGVFPLIYVCGRVTMFAIYCMFKVIRAMCQVLLNGGVMESEKDKLHAEERQQRIEERRQKRALKSRQTRLNKQVERQDQALSGPTSLRAKTPSSADSRSATTTSRYVPTKIVEKSSDISDSINSENEESPEAHKSHVKHA